MSNNPRNIIETSEYVPSSIEAQGVWKPWENLQSGQANNWPKLYSIQYVVVAGGGRGATGGGGAGGMLTDTALFPTGSYTITVGAGAPSGTSTATGGISVISSSTFTSPIQATGGGRGGSGNSDSTRPGNGGSGGGACTFGTITEGQAGGLGIPGQGNNGGSFSGNSALEKGAGGGGAGAVGTTQGGPPDFAGGAGGDGLANPINGSQAGELVSGTYYLAGGGGGLGGPGNPGGAGGKGGGGLGASDDPNIAGISYFGNTDGLPNTGGGGGNDRSGGSGIVILAYSNFNPLAKSTTGTVTYRNAGDKHIYEFLSSGTITF